MQVDIELIVARFKGVVIFAEAIGDCYTYVQVIISKKDIDEGVISELQKVSYYSESDTGFNLGEHEAKDACGTHGDLVIAIESSTTTLADKELNNG